MVKYRPYLDLALSCTGLFKYSKKIIFYITQRANICTEDKYWFSSIDMQKIVYMVKCRPHMIFAHCCKACFNPFPNKPWFLRVCSKDLLKTLWEKEKLLIMSNFSFTHSVFDLSGELSAIYIKFEIVACKLFQIT